MDINYASGAFTVKPRRQTRNLTLDRSILPKTSGGQTHTNSVTSLVMYKDILISSSWDSTIKVWSTDTWKCLATLDDQEDAVNDMCVCADKLVSCSDGTINVWQFSTDDDSSSQGWHLWHTIDSESESPINCVTSCEGRLASGDDNGEIVIWNAKTWTKDLTIQQLGFDENGVLSNESVAVSFLVGRDGQLFSGAADGTIRVWNTSTWVCEQVLQHGTDEVWSICFTPLGSMVSGSKDGSLMVWHQVAQESPKDDSSNSSTAFVHRPDMLATDSSSSSSPISHTGSVKTNWKMNQKIQGSRAITASCFFNDCIISTGYSETQATGTAITTRKLVRQWPEKIATLEFVGEFGLDNNSLSLIVCDGKLVSGEADGCIRVWK